VEEALHFEDTIDAHETYTRLDHFRLRRKYVFSRAGVPVVTSVAGKHLDFHQMFIHFEICEDKDAYGKIIASSVLDSFGTSLTNYRPNFEAIWQDFTIYFDNCSECHLQAINGGKQIEAKTLGLALSALSLMGLARMGWSVDQIVEVHEHATRGWESASFFANFFAALQNVCVNFGIEQPSIEDMLEVLHELFMAGPGSRDSVGDKLLFRPVLYQSDEAITVDYWALREKLIVQIAANKDDDPLRGKLLEKLCEVHGRSCLPTLKFKNDAGNSRQIDYARVVNGVLFLCDCFAKKTWRKTATFEYQAVRKFAEFMAKKFEKPRSACEWLVGSTFGGKPHEVLKGVDYVCPLVVVLDPVAIPRVDFSDSPHGAMAKIRNLTMPNGQPACVCVDYLSDEHLAELALVVPDWEMAVRVG
jgi:hypothetical protein